MIRDDFCFQQEAFLGLLGAWSARPSVLGCRTLGGEKGHVYTEKEENQRMANFVLCFFRLKQFCMVRVDVHVHIDASRHRATD
jgi:hypothetical protein